MTSLVIIPTYNEAENLPTLIEAVFHILPEIHILIIDDASPDGTGELLERLRRDQPRLFAIHRSAKGGYAGAYLEGFRWALGRGYDVVGQMDADLSHNPAVLPLMFEVIAADCHLAVGSRYVKGGGIENWALHRRFLSLCANRFARAALRCPIHDMTSGYVLWTRKALEALDLEGVRSRGYVFQIELKMRAHRRCLKLREVPIVFEERKKGRSKMTLGIIWEAFAQVIRLAALSSRLRSP